MDNAEFNKEDVKGLECRHSTYCQSNRSIDDLLVVKEYVHMKDGRRIPRVRPIHNYKRDFWVTREGHRKHKDKLEWEQESKLQRFSCTQAQLPQAVARALGKPGVKLPMRRLANSPYLYGTDIGPGPLLKKQYATKWPDCIHPEASVAVLDIETDVVNGTDEVILITLSFKNRVVTAATKAFIGSMYDPVNTINKCFEKYLGEYKEKRNINLEVVIADDAGHAVSEVMKRAHAWMPDFVIFWNMNFDLPKMIRDLNKYKYSLGDVFSDPSVPYEYRFFNYKEGPSQKVTASGKVMALHPADRWHVAECPASFYFLDAMCLYKRIRTAKGNEPSYSLDYILNKNLKLGKLKFEAADGLSKLEWHQKMQSEYKPEYTVYNIFDCIGVELLDEKTGDVSRAFSVLAEFSDFNNFKSTPRRISDDMHFFCREHGLVIASTGADMVDELDDLVISMKDWIITLPAEMLDDVGICAIEELPGIRSMVVAHLSDLDIEGTYPNIELAANISKETTYRELSAIRGVDESVRRLAGIGLTGGTVNAVEICNDIFKLPLPDQVLEMFVRDQN